MEYFRKLFRAGLLATLFIGLGIIIGLIVSSNLGLLPLGEGDEPERPESPPLVTTPSIRLPIQALEQPFVDIVKSARPAVVNIATSRIIKKREGSPFPPFFGDPFFRRFFGDEFSQQFEVPRERREKSLGSGVIVDSSGIIITNNHVIENADEIKVVLNDKREFKGEIIGGDPKTDIAVIRIDGKDLPSISWGDADRLQVGEYVLAIGNPFGLNQTVTMGIISAVGRAQVGIADYEDFIQTDAAINPGNSGGALINLRGELIGINTAIFSRSGGYMGIGFAVPSNMAQSVMQSLVRTGKVIRGWLGISIQDVNPDLAEQFGLEDSKGALVGDVHSGGPADRGGIKPGDVIVRYDGKSIEGSVNLRNTVAQTSVGKKVKVEVIRDNRRKVLEISIGEFPKDLAQLGEEPFAKKNESAALAGLDVVELSSEVARQLNLSPATSGVAVRNVESGSSADEAGIKPGDLILEMNQRLLRGLEEFKRMASQLAESRNILLLISREGRKFFVVLKP